MSDDLIIQTQNYKDYRNKKGVLAYEITYLLVGTNKKFNLFFIVICWLGLEFKPKTTRVIAVKKKFWHLKD